jgi:hypothetical protein
MVVTKYAPPPGYSGQQQAPAPRPSSQHQTWPSAPQQYAQNFEPVAYAGYPPQTYGAPTTHQQSQRPQSNHSGHYSQSYSQHASPPIATYVAPLKGSFHHADITHPSTFNYFQQSPPTEVVPTHARHSSVADTYGVGTDSYFPQGASHSKSNSTQGLHLTRHRSTPSVTYDYAAAYARQEAGFYDQTFPGASIDDCPELLEAEFDEECYYFDHPEEIQDDLSLGWIESQSALPTPRPLPSTFSEAELEALAPRPPPLHGDSCISEYFAAEKGEEQLNTVRLSEAWVEIKDDLIFKEFLQLGYETIRLDKMAQKYRNRVDTKWDRSDSSASISHFARASIEITGSLDSNRRRGSRPVSRTGSRNGHRENSIQYLDQNVPDGGRSNSQAPNYRPSSAASNHSRASSVCSRYSNQRPKALEPIRDQAQDDILAKLGVTGSPRLVYETPGPAFGPPASARSSRQSSVASIRDNPFVATSRAPSEPHQRPQDVTFSDPWGANGSQQQYRQHSGSSHYDLTSSEFTIMEDPDATPRPKGDRSHGLKRHYEGDHHDANREKRARDNEATPKQGRKQGRAAVDNYGRRW